MITGGLSLTGASMLYDIFVESPKTVGRYNEQVERDEVKLNPWVNPSNGATGIRFNVRF